MTATSRDRATPARGARRLAWALGAAALAAAAATIAVGSGHWDGEETLGTKLPPFVAGWDPRVHGPELFVALALFAAAVAASPALLRGARPRPPGVAAALYALSLALGLALNAIRYGPAGWSRVFDLGPGGSWEAGNEYLPGLPTLSYGVRVYLDRFAEVVPSQPVNVAGHPPGPLLLVHALGIEGPGGLAALCILAGSACAPLAYGLARALDGEATGRRAGLLCAFSPAALVFGVTSFDFVFAAAGALAALALVAPRPRVAAAVGGLALGLAALLSWALLGVAAWAAVVRWRRDGPRAALWVAGGCAAGVLVVNAILAAGWGYDPVGTLRATEQVYRDSLARERPYAFWVLGSPVAWGVTLGLPLAALALRSVVARRPAAVALVVVVLVAAVGGFTKAETERIWLFLVPLACVAAAPALRPGRVRLVLGALAVQALLTASLFNTVW